MSLLDGQGQASEMGNHLFFSLPVPDSEEDVEFRWGQVGSENQSFTKQSGVCFGKSTLPDPTRHHLTESALLNVRDRLRKRQMFVLFLSESPHPREALSKYGESDSAWRQNRPKMLSLSRRENGRP